MEIVSFVILHYKDRKTTDICVQSILRMKEQERIRIVIVDNDVKEKAEEREKLSALYQLNPRITVLPVYENGGFSYANNQGYRFAREELKASYIVILNNDIEFVQPDFLERLEESYKKYSCHVMGPDIIRRKNGEHQNPMDVRLRSKKEVRYTVFMNRLAYVFCPILYPVLSRKLKKEEQEKLRQKKENEIFYQRVRKDIVPFGACLIFTPDFVKGQVLAFTPETQFFYEEYILAYRCKKNGWSIVYDPALKVFHESGAATKSTYKGEQKRLRFMLKKTAQAGKVYLDMIQEDDPWMKKSKK